MTHDPCRTARSRQYMSAVFYHDDAQLAAIERTRDKFVKTPDKVQTEIAPLSAFWLAEDYHQKYRLQNDPLGDELKAIYPEVRDFVDSTAAARINGYLAGHGDRDQLQGEIGRLGLSPEGRDPLRRSTR